MGVVDNNGNVTIQNGNESWSGKVESNLNISLRKDFTINCFGTERNVATTYDGTIKQSGSAYALAIESIEEWCPQQGCIFRVSYSLSK